MDGKLILGVLVVAAVVVAIAYFMRRRRGRGPAVQQLAPADAARYLQEMDDIERSFIDEPQQAAARARGIVEEVMRRMGFPDRLDGKQRGQDLARHDREAGGLLQTASAHVLDHPGDTEKLRVAVQHYRGVLRRLLKAESPADVGAAAAEGEEVTGRA